MKFVLFILILASLPVAARAEPGWKDYINPRFGFKISYPPNLIAGPELDESTGRQFQTPDKTFSVVASGHLAEGRTLDWFWKEELKDYGKSITYKKKAADWFTFSGVQDGNEFYMQMHAKDGYWAEVSFLYPHAKASQYAPLVEKITKSFVPFLKGDYDRIVK